MAELWAHGITPMAHIHAVTTVERRLLRPFGNSDAAIYGEPSLAFEAHTRCGTTVGHAVLSAKLSDFQPAGRALCETCMKKGPRRSTATA